MRPLSPPGALRRTTDRSQQKAGQHVVMINAEDLRGEQHLLDRQLLISICYEHTANLWAEEDQPETGRHTRRYRRSEHTLREKMRQLPPLRSSMNILPYWRGWRRSRPGSLPLCLCIVYSGKKLEDRGMKDRSEMSRCLLMSSGVSHLQLLWKSSHQTKQSAVKVKTVGWCVQGGFLH